MNKSIATALLLMTTIMASAQVKETALIKINGKVISAEEFNYIYEKNNPAAQQPISKKEYLDLFINYKLKVEEGRAMGIDTTKQYKNESSYYYEELAKPYQNDTVAQKAEENILKARLEEEVDASHILVRIPDHATPTDTLTAYNKAQRARQEIMNGADFATVAKRVSEDPSAQQNGGRLGFFSALQMVEPFENAAFNTEIGTISPIFRSQYGYHFIKVHAKRPYPGEVQTAHIMKIFPRGYSQTQKDSLKLAIDSVYTMLQNGADFAKMAKEFSEDQQTAINGGMMPWLSESQLNQGFKEYGRQAFALAHKGDYSKVFETSFGWHIVKLIDRKDKRTDDELQQIVNNAKRHGHPVAGAGFKKYGQKLLKEYSLKWNDATKHEITQIMMSNEPDSIKKKHIMSINAPLATYGKGESINVNDRNIATFWMPNANLEEIFNDIAISNLSDYDKKELPKKHADFKYTMQEYYDGLIVFEVNKKTIWNTENVDTTALVKLYTENPSRYTKGSSFDGNIYFCKDEKTAKKVKTLASKNIEKATKLAEKVISGKQEKGGIYDEYLWPNVTSKYVVVCGTYSNGEKMSFEEAKTQLVTDYQQKYETEYMKKLADKFKPKIVGKLK